MGIIILSTIYALAASDAWAIIFTYGPEIPPGTAAVVLAGLTAGVLMIRARRRQPPKSQE